jgi:Putative zinc-finger
MSETFHCEDKDTLVAYLYGEIDADLRREVERHARACAACAREIEDLQAVRHDLASWLPPEADLGFTITQKPATVLTPVRWASLRSMPAWAQVAAAMFVMAVGAAIANLQVRYGSDGVVLSTGWMQQASTTSSLADAMPRATAGPASTDRSWQPALVALEQSLRAELAQMKQAAGPSAVPAHAREASDSAILRRVQGMLDASEERQRQEMALRLAQVDRDWNLRRQGDLLRINQNLGSLQGRTFATQANQQEVMNILRRVSAGQPIP